MNIIYVSTISLRLGRNHTSDNDACDRPTYEEKCVHNASDGH